MEELLGYRKSERKHGTNEDVSEKRKVGDEVDKGQRLCSNKQYVASVTFIVDSSLCHVGSVFSAVSLLVCLSFCKQDCVKHTKLVSMYLVAKVSHGPRRNPSNFGADPSQGADPRTRYHCDI